MYGICILNVNNYIIILFWLHYYAYYTHFIRAEHMCVYIYNNREYNYI